MSTIRLGNELILDFYNRVNHFQNFIRLLMWIIGDHLIIFENFTQSIVKFGHWHCDKNLSHIRGHYHVIFNVILELLYDFIVFMQCLHEDLSLVPRDFCLIHFIIIIIMINCLAQGSKQYVSPYMMTSK